LAASYVSTDTNDAFGDSDNIVASTVDAAVGDLVVVSFGQGNDDTATCVDSAGNSWTAIDPVISGNKFFAWYSVINNAIVNGTVTVTIDESRVERKNIIVDVFSKDAGDTWSFDSEASGTGFGTAISSGNLTTTGDDEVGWALYGHNSDKTFSSPLMAEGAATFSSAQLTFLVNAYKIFSATQSNIDTDCTIDDNASWAVIFLTFKSVAAAAFVESKRGIARGVGRGIRR
jgi:hypothetical protein